MKTNLIEHKLLASNFNKVDKGDLDIVIFPYDKYHNLEYLDSYDKVTFSSSIYKENILIIYQLNNKNSGYYNFYKKIIILWLYCILSMVILSILFKYWDVYFFNEQSKYLNYFNVFLGGGFELFNSRKKIDLKICFYFIFLSFLVYVVHVTVSSITYSKTAIFEKSLPAINRTMSHQKIVINGTNKKLYNIVKNSGGFPIRVPYIGKKLVEYYQKNIQKYDGFIVDPVTIKKKIKGNMISFEGISTNFNISSNRLTFTDMCFPVNNKKKKFLRDLNLEIRKITFNQSSKINQFSKKICLKNNLKLSKFDEGYLINYPCKL